MTYFELLFLAVKGCDICAEDLLCEGVDPNGALCVAAREGHGEVLRSLLEARADVHQAALQLQGLRLKS